MMEHVPNGVFGALRSSHGSLGFVDTIVMFAVAGTMLYGGLWVLIKFGDAVRWVRAEIERRQSNAR